MHLLGAAGPAHLENPASSGSKGYWESAAVARLNDRLLEARGSAWNDWGPVDLGGEDVLEPWASTLADLIRAEFGQSGLFVLKDPRFCRTAPVALRALARLGIAPKIVIPVRNPLECAASLGARDGLPREEALLLWLRHVLDAEAASRRCRRCFVAFDDLLQDWRPVADRLAASLEIAWPNTPAEATEAIRAFLSADQRQHRMPRETLDTLEPGFSWLPRVYDILTGLARGGELDAEQCASLDEIRRHFDAGATVFRAAVDKARGRESDARNRLAELQAHASTQRQEIERTRAAAESHASEAQALWRELIQARIALHNERAKESRRFGPLSRRMRATKSAAQGPKREARDADLIRASGLFDAEWYCARYPDVKAAALDPVLHYLRHGAAARRDPSPRFSTGAYLRRHLDVASAKLNPLVHFLDYGINEGRMIEPAAGTGAPAQAAASAERTSADGSLTAEHLKFTRRGPAFEEFDPAILAGAVSDVKLLAFYLPQFHAIPENDQNWGKGFTEWRQIVRGLPRFPGHYQPRVPRDLGFYDLTDSEVMRRQIAMAKAAGIHGFGFYYYWFDSHRVLERPLEAFLASPDMDMPFMVVWANENWTRTWDGLSGDVLLHQNYDPRHEKALLADLARHFKDPRYVRFGGRPFFVIYQPRHVPDPEQTFARWRAHWKAAFGLEPIMFMAQTFGVVDPRPFGLDGAIEFPPHKLASKLRGRSMPDAFEPTFGGRVISYDDVSAISLAEPDPPYPLIRTVVPGWDNDARRPMRGTSMEGSTPDKYERWLSAIIARAKEKPVFGKRIVAINAWNEWAEGAYLEPDLHYGAAYLNATARALLPSAVTKPRIVHSLVLVGHDARDHGAQRLLVNIGSVLARRFGTRVRFVLLKGGPLLARYEEVAPCTVLPDDAPSTASEVFASLARQGFTRAIANTTATGGLIPQMKAAGFRIVSLVHEMPGIIQANAWEEQAAAIGRGSDAVVFAGSPVHDRFRRICGEIAGRVAVKPQGLYRTEIAPAPQGAAALRDALGVPRDAKLVLNVGHGDLRKGFDLFTRAARATAKRRRDVYFVWVGNAPGKEPDGVGPGSRREANGAVIAVGPQENIGRYYAAADAFFLSSREDPYPSVVLEAMAAGLPVVGFAGATGCEDLIKSHGAAVPFEDIEAAVAAIEAFLDLPADQARLGAEARVAEIRANYAFDEYCFWLLLQLDPDLPQVSVVVPNYNHERYIAARLESIFHQSCPIYQVIVLDDASTDGSVSSIRRIAAEHRRDLTLIANETNSGSPARQWRKGVARCTGEFVWIAESDDVADPAFVDACVQALERTGADFCFTDSWQIDGDGKRTKDSFALYGDRIERGAFDRDFEMDGREFLRRYLSIKNVIVNMSGVLWRRTSLEQAILAAAQEMESFALTCDWRLYVAACASGQKLVYLSKALNGHRRHAQAVTMSLDKQQNVDEVRRLQAVVAREVELDGEIRDKARDHLARLHRFFGLPDAATESAQLRATPAGDGAAK